MNKKTPRIKLLTGFAAVAAVLLLAYFFAPRQAGLKTTKTPSPSSSPSNHGTGNSAEVTSSATPIPSSSSNAGSKVTPSPTQAQAPSAPAAPTGSVLNIHQASISGADKLESGCQTTPGYNCGVTATNNSSGKVVTIPAVKADANGVAIIDWNAKNLSVGAWTIRLFAANGNLTTQSEIHDQLEVVQ